MSSNFKEQLKVFLPSLNIKQNLSPVPTAPSLASAAAGHSNCGCIERVEEISCTL